MLTSIKMFPTAAQFYGKLHLKRLTIDK